MQSLKILTGDVLEQLATRPSDFFDAVLSDPPYGLSFMGKEWDKGVPSRTVYAELQRTLKPGAFGLHFGGTRTFHRLAVNLEDAGFEIRDCLSWLYGSGFPKSHNISKALDKRAGVEREVIGFDEQKAKQQTRAVGTAAYGDYAGNAGDITAPATPAAIQWNGYGTALKPAWEPCLLVQKPLAGTFANNVLEHGCGALNIDGCRIGTDDTRGKASLTAMGVLNDDNWQARQVLAGSACGRFPANLLLDEEAAAALDASVGDKGGPSRFFYTAKVSTKERTAGTEGNNHPTLKPLALTEYLARLLLVPPRTDGQPRRIIVPFSGAGSEMIGCLLAGWEEVYGIEIDPAYVEIAKARVAHHAPAARLL